jgi:hypothetical protein
VREREGFTELTFSVLKGGKIDEKSGSSTANNQITDPASHASTPIPRLTFVEVVVIPLRPCPNGGQSYISWLVLYLYPQQNLQLTNGLLVAATTLTRASLFAPDDVKPSISCINSVQSVSKVSRRAFTSPHARSSPVNTCRCAALPEENPPRDPSKLSASSIKMMQGDNRRDKLKSALVLASD